MSKKKKILLLTGGIGGETTEANTYYSLFSKNVFNADVYLVTLYKLEKNEIIPENKIIELKRKRSLNPFIKMLNLVLWVYAVKNVKSEIHPDISISLSDPANLVNVLTARDFEKILIRFAGTLSNVGLYQGEKLCYGALYKFFYKAIVKFVYSKKASFATFISMASFIDITNNFYFNPSKGIVLYNPIDIQLIKKKTSEFLGLYEEIFAYPTIITVGRLTKAKGQWSLIRAFRRLKEQFPEVKLLLIGDGELKRYLATISEAIGLKTFLWDRDQISRYFDIYFLGFQKNPFKFLARSRLFALPSLWEGFPYALVEALACNLPAIASDCKSGPREILAPSTSPDYRTKEPEFAEFGVLMPVFERRIKRPSEPLDSTEKVWAEVLYRMLTDESVIEKYSRKAAERAKDFDIETIAQKWAGIVQALSKH